MSDFRGSNRNPYFQELSLNLQHEGLTVGSEEDGLLPVKLDGRRLCLVLDTGGVRYWMEDIAGSRNTVLEQVKAIARTTAEYISEMEAAPFLTVSGLKGDYRLLAEFNGTVLAGHPTRYGVQFVTWQRDHDGSGLSCGHNFSPQGYAAAKQDFAVRSGLVRRSALFAPEQLTEIYRCIHETLDSGYPITDERMERLRSAAEQIEWSVPDLDERVSLSNQKELELSNSFGENGMQFC